MMGYGWMEMLILIGMGGGTTGGDFVSFLPADKYFESRKIEVNVQSMLDLASKEPKDAKAEIAQLLALRLLGERLELIKDAKNQDEILKTIEKIAKGELGKDKQGFAQDYAAHVLAALGRPVDRPMTKTASREEMLGWFPASATLVGAIVPRPREAGTPPPASLRELRKLTTKMMPPEQWEKVFQAAEAIGNVRVDRIAFAYADDAKDGDRIYVRLTGKADPKRLVDTFRLLAPAVNEKFTVAESQDAKGTPITTISFGEDGPVVAFIGTSDCVIAGYAGSKAAQGRKQQEVMAHLLNVRAGKAESVLKGPLQATLAKVSEKANGLVVGELPSEVRRGMSRDGTPAPRSIRGEAVTSRDGLDLRGEAVMDSPDDAKNAVQMILQGQKKMLDTLQKIPAGTPVPAGTIAGLKRAVESLQAKAEGNTVHVGVFMPTDALFAAPLWFMTDVEVDGAAPKAVRPPPLPPPPPPKNPPQASVGAFAG